MRVPLIVLCNSHSAVRPGLPASADHASDIWKTSASACLGGVWRSLGFELQCADTFTHVSPSRDEKSFQYAIRQASVASWLVLHKHQGLAEAVRAACLQRSARCCIRLFRPRTLLVPLSLSAVVLIAGRRAAHPSGGSARSSCSPCAYVHLSPNVQRPSFHLAPNIC